MGKREKTNGKENVVLKAIASIIILVATGLGGIEWGKIQVEAENRMQFNEIVGENNNVYINNSGEFIEYYKEIVKENGSLELKNQEYLKEIDKLKDKLESVEDYEKLYVEVEKLKSENDNFAQELKGANAYIEELKLELENMPLVTMADRALVIEGDDILINRQGSMVIIDGREYLSKEIAEKLVPDGKQLLITNDEVCVGKMIAEKASLFDKWVVHGKYIDKALIRDSYGYEHLNAICLKYNESEVIYNLEEKYNYMRFTVALSEKSLIDSHVTISIKADDEVVFTKTIDKLTKQITSDIPINGCSLLDIKVDSDTYDVFCIVSDAYVYN